MKERSADYDAATVFLQSLPMRELGNFGGVVFSNDILTWCRDSMEASIAKSTGGRLIYNCSDGLRIKGARAQIASGVRLPAVKEPKSKIVKRLFERWPEASTFKFKEQWDTADWPARLHTYADAMIDICETEPERTQAFLHRMGIKLIPIMSACRISKNIVCAERRWYRFWQPTITPAACIHPKNAPCFSPWPIKASST